MRSSRSWQMAMLGFWGLRVRQYLPEIVCECCFLAQCTTQPFLPTKHCNQCGLRRCPYILFDRISSASFCFLKVTQKGIARSHCSLQAASTIKEIKDKLVVRVPSVWYHWPLFEWVGWQVATAKKRAAFLPQQLLYTPVHQVYVGLTNNRTSFADKLNHWTITVHYD